MRDKLYKLVEPIEGALVQFVGVYVTRWQSNWGEPTVGFVELEEEMKDESIQNACFDGKQAMSDDLILKILLEQKSICPTCQDSDVCLCDEWECKRNFEAIAQYRNLWADRDRLKAMIAHCDNCGGSWLDDGINVKCACHLKADRDRLRKVLKGFMSYVTWEGNNPGYPLNPDVGEALIAMREALEDKP